MLQKKATGLSKHLGMSSEFRASAGFITRFKERHAIVSKVVSGEPLSASCKGVIESLSATTEQAWQAGIIVQTPFSVALAVRAQPFAVAVFDSHRPVIALLSRFVGKTVACSFLAYLLKSDWV